VIPCLISALSPQGALIARKESDPLCAAGIQKGEGSKGSVEQKTMAEITTKIPKQFNAGETVVFKQYDSSLYPQSQGFTQKFSINGATAKVIDGTFADGIWTFELKAKDNTFTPGIYSLYGYATKGADDTEETYTLYKQPLTIEASLKAGSAADQRSQYQQELDLLNAVIKQFEEDGLLSVTIGTRTYQRMELQALQKQRQLVIRQINLELYNGKRKKYFVKLSNY
jgi:hypothetical protein